MKKFTDVLTGIAASEGYWYNQDLIYDENGNVIGRMQIHHYDEHYVFISLIAIYPEYRRQGHFSYLLELISRVADLNGDTIELLPMETDCDKIPCSGIGVKKLQSLYEECGFTPDDDGLKVSTYTRIPRT